MQKTNPFATQLVSSSFLTTQGKEDKPVSCMFSDTGIKIIFDERSLIDASHPPWWELEEMSSIAITKPRLLPFTYYYKQNFSDNNFLS